MSYLKTNFFFFIFFRLVSSTRQTDSIVFNVRCGTGEGVITHFLRAETHRDLAAWARALVQGAHQCVSNQRELVCRKLNVMMKSTLMLFFLSTNKY